MPSSETRRATRRTRLQCWLPGTGKQMVCVHMLCREKGIGGGYAVKQCLRDIKNFGYHHTILIRSDGEPAIRDLLDRVCQLRASETLLEVTPAGDSKSNGRAERAVQAIENKNQSAGNVRGATCWRFQCDPQMLSMVGYAQLRCIEQQINVTLLMKHT